MAAIQNERTLLLQATVPRIQPYQLPPNTSIPVAQVDGAIADAPAVELSAPTNVFRVSADGVAAPTSITLTATLNMISGTTSWAVVDGTATLTGTGTSRSLAYADMDTNAITVRVEVFDGITYFDEFTIVKTQDGIRGPRTFPQVTGSVWDDAAADAQVLSITGSATRISGDVITITNFVDFTETRYWDGADWVVSIIVVEGSNITIRSIPLDKLAFGPQQADADATGFLAIQMADTWTPNNTVLSGWGVRANDATVHGLSAFHSAEGIAFIAASAGVLSSNPAIQAYGTYDDLAGTWTNEVRIGAGPQAILVDYVGFSGAIIGHEDYAGDFTTDAGRHVRLGDGTYAIRIFNGTFRYGAVTIDQPPNSPGYLNGDGSWQSLSIDTGSATATQVLTNKPGGPTANQWLEIEIDGDDYVMPIWPRT